MWVGENISVNFQLSQNLTNATKTPNISRFHDFDNRLEQSGVSPTAFFPPLLAAYQRAILGCRRELPVCMTNGHGLSLPQSRKWTFARPPPDRNLASFPSLPLGAIYIVSDEPISNKTLLSQNVSTSNRNGLDHTLRETEIMGKSHQIPPISSFAGVQNCTETVRFRPLCVCVCVCI